jgi:hypothetical protein
VDTTTGSVGPDDRSSFVYVMLTCIAIGTFTTIIFHYSVNPQNKSKNEEEVRRTTTLKNIEVEPMTPLDWLKEPQLYQVSQ